MCSKHMIIDTAITVKLSRLALRYILGIGKPIPSITSRMHQQESKQAPLTVQVLRNQSIENV